MNQVNMSNGKNGFSNFKVRSCNIAQQGNPTAKANAKLSYRKINIKSKAVQFPPIKKAPTTKITRLPPTKKASISKTYTEFEFNINNIEEETQLFQLSTKRQTIAQLQKERSQQRLTQILQEKNLKYKQIPKLQNPQPRQLRQPQSQIQHQQTQTQLQRTTSIDTFDTTSICNSKNLTLSKSRSLPIHDNNSLFEMINFNNNNGVELSLPNCIPKLNFEMEYTNNISPITTPDFLFINTQSITML
eukprot:Pgem_evm1s18459